MYNVANATLFFCFLLYNFIIERERIKGMKVIKRDGHMVEYCPAKIEEAIEKANLEVEEEDKASSIQIKNIIKYIERLGKKEYWSKIFKILLK